VFDAEQADAIGPCRCGTYCCLGKGDIDLDTRCSDHRCGCGGGDRLCLLPLDLNCTIVDESLLSIDSNQLAWLEDLRCRLRPDNCRGSEFPAHDRCMACHSPFVRDDSGDSAHRRDHVRVGHPRDKDVAFLHPSRILCIMDDDDFPACNPGRGPLSPEDDVPGTNSSTCLLCFFWPYRGDGTRLEDVDGVPDYRPFHVLGHSVVVLGNLSVFCKFCNFLVGEEGNVREFFWDFRRLGPMLTVGYYLEPLVCDEAVHHLPCPHIEYVLVRGDRSRYNRFAETP